MSEEDQMMRAIAMSLGQEVSMEQRSDSPEVRNHLMSTLASCNDSMLPHLILGNQFSKKWQCLGSAAVSEGMLFLCL